MYPLVLAVGWSCSMGFGATDHFWKLMRRTFMKSNGEEIL